MPARKQSTSTPITSLKHSDRRANIPTEELRDFVADDEQAPKTLLYPRDPSLDPQLVWRGKDEQDAYDLAVPAVPIYIQEKIHPQALINDLLAQAARPGAGLKEAAAAYQLALFADFNGGPEEFDQKVEFYQHEQNWANRMILGDSLLVMASLAEKEGLRGRVQMMYIDPPYGIKFGSNWQVSTRKRDVKDGKAEDATRQPEQIRAFRDTWKLGIHSYLAYLRDRLVVARELLTETGSMFVQINSENSHLMRNLLDEVFGSDNFVADVYFRKKSIPLGARYLETMHDQILFYAKDAEHLKFRHLYEAMDASMLSSHGPYALYPNGETERVRLEDVFSPSHPKGTRYYRLFSLLAPSFSASTVYDFDFEGRAFAPPSRGSWVISKDKLSILATIGRLQAEGTNLSYRLFYDDFPYRKRTNTWTDAPVSYEKSYVVQTSPDVIARCLLMTTDPGDLVLDPTCVRKGTGVYAPTPALPVNGEGENLPPFTGGAEGGLTPIDSLRPGDWVLGHDRRPHRVLRLIRKPYRGQMVGIRHSLHPQTLWLTADHLVLCKPRPRTLGGQRDWSASPITHLERRKQLRREATPAERRLWSAVRNEQLGIKFRRQHPIGPYIADLCSREAHLVIELDGSGHFEPEQIQYDAERDAYMRHLGLDVLRFTNDDIEHNLPGVSLAIQNHVQTRLESLEGAQWVQASALQPGDLVFCGPDLRTAEVQSVESAYAEEEVYDLEIEGTHSFLTEVCAVHNCGSGTTAYVAEQWGRRWITCDTSRVALALARTRLMSARYPYYYLADDYPQITQMNTDRDIRNHLRQAVKSAASSSDIRKGFVYKRVPHVTLKSIANNPDIHEGMTREEIDAAIARHTDTETLYDQPYEDAKRVRVCGPFSVESLSPHRVLATADEYTDSAASEQQARQQQDFAAMILDNLRKAGVQNTRKSERLTFDRLDPYAGAWLHAAGEYTEAPLPREQGRVRGGGQARSRLHRPGTWHGWPAAGQGSRQRSGAGGGL